MKGVPSSALETKARRGATTRRCHQTDGGKRKEEIKKRRGDWEKGRRVLLSASIVTRNDVREGALVEGAPLVEERIHRTERL